MRTAVNWPKVFYADGITPCTSGVEPREKLLEFLTQHQVPWGTETKFLAFFDYAVKRNKNQKTNRPPPSV
jgi:hypothetical protein